MERKQKIKNNNSTDNQNKNNKNDHEPNNVKNGKKKITITRTNITTIKITK